jgi:hypothetical protein
MEHTRTCHQRFLALMMGKQSGQTASARLRGFTQIAGCDNVSSLSDIRHYIRSQVARADPGTLLRIDEFSETAKDELIAAQVIADTSGMQDKALVLAHANAITRLTAGQGAGTRTKPAAPSAPADHAKREEDARGGGLSAAAVSYQHLASGRWGSPVVAPLPEISARVQQIHDWLTRSSRLEHT